MPMASAILGRPDEGLDQQLRPRFKHRSALVTEYAVRAYTPAARGWQRLRENSLAPARSLAAWLEKVTAAWPSVQVDSVDDDAGREASGEVRVRAVVQLAGLAPDDVAVHVVHGHASAEGELAASSFARLEPGCASGDSWRFEGAYQPAGGGRSGYVIRILPQNDDLHDPFATGLVRWS